MSKLTEAIKKAEAVGVDPEVEVKRKENLDLTLASLYKQAAQVKRGIDEYNSMNRQARRIPSNKKQFEMACGVAKVLLQRIDMFEQVKRELSDDTAGS